LELSAGTIVGRDLRLVRHIGAGAMGEVWEAEHERLATSVAVKFIDAELAQKNPIAFKRFRNEALVAAKIKSPHIAQVFDTDVTDDGTPYIVMELLDGETLAHRLENGPLHVDDCTNLVVQMCRALGQAHRRGIVHRDIKPSNIFLCEMEGPLFCKLLDFGVSKQLETPGAKDLTSPGMLVGTPAFLSPEVITNKRESDAYLDLWAVAVVAYCALTLEVPFDGETIGELCRSLLTTDAAPISQHRADLPGDLDAWFAKALAREPEQRFPSARELADAFVAAAHGTDTGRPSWEVRVPSGRPSEDGILPPLMGTDTSLPGLPAGPQMSSVEQRVYRAFEVPASARQATVPASPMLAATGEPVSVGGPSEAPTSSRQPSASIRAPAPRKWVGRAGIAVAALGVAIGAWYGLRGREAELTNAPSAAAAAQPAATAIATATVTATAEPAPVVTTSPSASASALEKTPRVHAKDKEPPPPPITSAQPPPPPPTGKERNWGF
jgi:eukaryotic-like serine/threonine-protein kinase